MKNARLLLKYFAPYRWSATMTIFYNILSSIFGLLTIALIQPFLEVLFVKVETISDPGSFHLTSVYIANFTNYYLSLFIQNHGKSGALMLVVLIVIGSSFFKNIFVFLSNNRIAFIRASTVRDIRRKIYDKILILPLSFFTDSRKGDVMTRISNDVQEIEVSVINSLTMLFRDPLTVFIFVGYLFILSYRLSLFVLVLLPLSGWLIGMAGRTLRSASLQGQQHLGRLLSIVEETLTGLRIIKGFNAEEKMKAQFSVSNDRYSKMFKRVIRKAFLASPLSEFLSTIVVTILLFVGGSMALNGTGNMTPATLIVFLAVFTQIIQPVKNITTSWYSIQRGMASIDRIDQILDADEKVLEKDDAKAISGFSDSIEFKGSWYAYNNEPVLKDINLKIKKGQTVAIVGKSGAGKSTLVDLLPRFMDVDQGSIMIDGVDVRDLKTTDLRYLMGIVSQNPILFNTSFKENIAFGVKTSRLDDVEVAARIANAHDFIMETENGYESTVGESGNKLSGGQRQRISIARAIMANPPILILDEATSALDTESERLVQDAILKLMKNRTSVIIAHRLSTIQHADVIIVLEDGRIVESGTHEDLMMINSGFYRKLHSFQAI